MNVTLPDGRVVKNVPEGTTKAQLVQKLKANGMDVPDAWVKQATREELRNPVTGMRGALEATANVATGAAAFPLQLGAGLAGAVLPGPPGQGQDYMNKVGEAFVYQPKTLAGQAIADTAHAPGEWLGNKAQQAGKAVADVAGAGAGAVTDATIQTAPMLFGLGGKSVRPTIERVMTRRATEAAAEASRGSVKSSTYERARSEGFKVAPSEFNDSFVKKQLEGARGKAALKQDLIMKNQEIVDKISRREAGLAPDSPINEESLAEARKAMSTPLEELASISPAAAAELEKFRQAKANAQEQWNFYHSTKNPAERREALKQAQQFDKEADNSENLLSLHAKFAGKGDLPKRVEIARRNLAKNYEVERALNVGNGSVDPQYFAREINKKGINRYSEGLQTIGLFAKAFPNYVRESSKVYMPGVSHLDAVGSAAAIVTGHALAGGLPLLRVPARSLLLTDGFQPTLNPYRAGLGLRTARAVTDGRISDPASLILMSEETRKGLGL